MAYIFFEQFIQAIQTNTLQDLHVDLNQNNYIQLPYEHTSEQHLDDCVIQKLIDILQSLKHNHTIASIIFPSIESEGYYLDYILSTTQEMLQHNNNLQSINLECSYMRGNKHRILTITSNQPDIKLSLLNRDNAIDNFEIDAQGNIRYTDDSITEIKRNNTRKRKLSVT